MKIVTHNAKFHTDDVFAVAALLIIYPDAEIIRTRDEEIIKDADIVIDVGGIYNEENNRFDHHQSGGAGERSNGIPYSSFGLVWKRFGEKLSGSKEVMERIDRILAQSIDAADNGKDISTALIPEIFPFTINGVVDSYRLTWKEDDDWNARFQECLKWATSFLRRLVKIERDVIEGEGIVREAYALSKDKRLLVIGEEYSLGRELVGGVLSKLPEPIYAVLFRNDHKNWQLLAIRKEPGNFESRKALPEAWRAKRDGDLDLATGVDGGVFCHRTGFICVTKTKEGALALAKIALDA